MFDKFKDYTESKLAVAICKLYFRDGTPKSRTVVLLSIYKNNRFDIRKPGVQQQFSQILKSLANACLIWHAAICMLLVIM